MSTLPRPVGLHVFSTRLGACVSAPGPHDLAVRERLHLSLPDEVSRNLIEGSMKTGLNVVRAARFNRSRETRPATYRAQRIASTASSGPRLVTIAKRPSWRAGMRERILLICRNRQPSGGCDRIARRANQPRGLIRGGQPAPNSAGRRPRLTNSAEPPAAPRRTAPAHRG
jgi:hypothetical protein